MTDKYLMDSHKCIWHLDRFNDWLNGKRIAPVHIDVGLTRNCNIKCHYCFGQLQGTKLAGVGPLVYFPREPLLRYMRDAGEIGVRSMAYQGEGEPLLNPHVYEAIVEGKKAGVDISLATNGTLYDTGREGEEALEHLSWIKFNICAASDEAYRRLQGSKLFSVAVEKLKWAVGYKRKRNLDVTIGLQTVVTPKDVDQVVPLAKLGKEWGVDYFVIKQCSDMQDNSLGIFKTQLDNYKFADILAEAESYSSGDYNVIPKWNMINNIQKRSYDTCLGVPFLLFSSGIGNLTPCGCMFGADDYIMGNLTKQSLKDIWESERYWDIVEKIKEIDAHTCYNLCRTHGINEFCWQLTHPPEHVNFI